jgi:hypothetical protein
MDEGLALLHSNLTIHPEERGVAERAFTEILRLESVWHSDQLGHNDWQGLASLIADILDPVCLRALFP